MALASLTTNADGVTRINGGAAGNLGVRTTGDQTYNDPVTLNSATNTTTLTSTAGSVAFINTLNSFQANEEDLLINVAVNVNFNDTVGGAANGRLDDLVVAAGNNITLKEVNVTNTVNLTATGGMIIDNNAAANNINAMSLIAFANTGLSLDTAIVNLTATNLTSGGIDINELNDLNVLSVSAPAQTAAIVAGGNMATSIVNAGTANLTAGGAITDANGPRST